MNIGYINSDSLVFLTGNYQLAVDAIVRSDAQDFIYGVLMKSMHASYDSHSFVHEVTRVTCHSSAVGSHSFAHMAYLLHLYGLKTLLNSDSHPSARLLRRVQRFGGLEVV